MPDREKVIKALACCVFPVSKGFPYQSHFADEGCEVDECPYRDNCDQMLLDALELLKEQELLAVYEGKVNKCVCGNEINRYWHPEYCGFCGKKLEWY